MNTREDAIEFLHTLQSEFPRLLLNKVEDTQRGVGFVLAYLVRTDGEVIAGDLARELNVSTARIAALLKTMEKNGLITRHSSPKDARRTVVEITPAGIRRTCEIRDQSLQKIELLLERVGKEDLDKFIRISHKINTALDE